MRLKIMVLLVAVISLFAVLSGSADARGANPGNPANIFDNTTEAMLIALNENNYQKFSAKFDEKMRESITENQFKALRETLQSKIGSFISKEYVGSKNENGLYVVEYKAQFSLEKSFVIIRTVFSGTGDETKVAGFWLDSPNLRK